MGNWPVLVIALAVMCYLLWLFVKLRRLSKLKSRLQRRVVASGRASLSRSRRRRHHPKE